MLGCKGSTFGRAGTRGWTCTGMHRRGRGFKRAARRAGRHGSRQACADEHRQAHWLSMNVRDVDVHACMGGRLGSTGGRTSAHGDGCWKLMTGALFTREHDLHLKW
ncbi:hypothetical protein CDL15_Pgr012476 [Punica granatum]|uniref:Uncharacterized protein n=1 Tax=Punica granatum TaxID=22663 RepID=A0A218WYH8_PUNGR|nr:hypothetical protein CDL15_Pgr012476 [Punica granatum]